MPRRSGGPACRQAGLVDWEKSAGITMKFYIYALKSKYNNYIYVGLTNNLQRRIGQHNKGQARSTKAYIPFVLLHSETRDTRMEARLREKYLKSGTGKEFLKSLL